MIQTKPFALLCCALALAGCAGNTSQSPKAPSLGWDMPGMQLGGDRGLPVRADTPCRKRGCDNDKLFFNPAQTEPNVTSIHRGW